MEPPMNINLDDIYQLASTIWETTIALPIEPDRGESEAQSARSTVACIQITGAWSGAVMLACPEPVARHAAAVMFSASPVQVTAADMQDAVAELTNMLAGNIKGLLPQGCFMSLPTVVEGTDYSTRLPGSRVLHRVNLMCTGNRVTITILERTKSQRVAA